MSSLLIEQSDGIAEFEHTDTQVLADKSIFNWFISFTWITYSLKKA